MMKYNPLVRPFLKWAGGKRQLIPEIKKYIPSKLNRYFEPFVGGGALFLGLQHPKVVINDSNSELINCYSIVRNSIDELIDFLKFYQGKNQEEFYYIVREMDRSPQFKDKSEVERAARLIYLNKTCYNGLFRVNSQGHFNVPFGRYKNPNILDEAVLKAVSKYLHSCEFTIFNADFADAIETASRGDFIYFDPPYDPVSSTASFTGYDVNGFNRTEQERLKKCVDKLTDRGCKVLLSNAHTPFIVELYRDYRQVKVAANRAINSIAEKRGKVDEILIMNSYE